jgi:hypothetical protein
MPQGLEFLIFLVLMNLIPAAATVEQNFANV